jgi:D-alanyl-D-alanine carboxypeptidase/D-alanyl-D-alanine-endopeptidase (penicillin-binding protein 4)
MHLFAYLLVFPLLSPVLGEPPASRVPEAEVERLGNALEVFASDKLFDGLEVGLSLRCNRDPSLLASHRGDRLMTPASGAKLLTTAAALALLPLDTRFKTAVRARLESGRATGLTLVGGGDPALDIPDLERLVDRLVEAGLTRIDGPIAYDTTYFADSSTPPAFDTKKTDAAYRPEVPALGLSSGAFTITVKPGKKSGAPVIVTTSPSVPSIIVENSATTAPGKAIDKLVIEARDAGSRTRVIVSGTLGEKAPNQGVRKRLADPALTTAEVFAELLERRGLLARQEGLKRARSDAPEVAFIEGRPLPEIVEIINKTSNNFMAETLFKQLASYRSPTPATWARADEVTSATLIGLGLPASSFDVVNGSGLYAGTRITPNAMTALLSRHHPPSPAHDAFRSSLAVSGESGTLKNRLKKLKGRVSGKTGTLDDALSLSGYIQRDDCPLSFAIFVNGKIGPRAPKVVARIDRLISSLAGVK